MRRTMMALGLMAMLWPQAASADAALTVRLQDWKGRPLDGKVQLSGPVKRTCQTKSLQLFVLEHFFRVSFQTTREMGTSYTLVGWLASYSSKLQASYSTLAAAFKFYVMYLPKFRGRHSEIYEDPCLPLFHQDDVPIMGNKIRNSCFFS